MSSPSTPQEALAPTVRGLKLASPRDTDIGKLLEQDPDEISLQDLSVFCMTWEPSTSSVQALANACRRQEWRLPLRQAGILARCLVYLALELPSRYDKSLEHELLRLVANCAAEVDENRQMAIQAMPTLWAIAERADSNCYAALNAVLNLCMNYEPGQKKAVEIGIRTRSLKILNGRNTEPAAVNTCFDLLATILPSATASNQSLPLQLLQKMITETIGFPEESDQDDYSWRLEVVVSLLKNENVLTMLASNASGVRAAMSILEDCVQRLVLLHGHSENALEDDETPWDEYLNEMVHALAQIVTLWQVVPPTASAHGDTPLPAFANDPTVSAIQSWFVKYSEEVMQSSSPGNQFKVWCAFAAALMLGNMIQTTATANEIARLDKVVEMAVKITLAPLGDGGQERELKNAATGLLRNLAPSKENKALLREHNIFKTVATQLTQSTNTASDLELSVVTLRLLRSVLAGSNANVIAFLHTETEPDPFRPFQLIMERIPTQVREYHRAVHPDNWGHVPRPRIVTEVGRTITEIYRAQLVDSSRVDHGTPPSADVLATLDTSCHAVEAVLFLLNHPDPSCVSSGWLGLGAMSRRKLAANSIWCALTGHSGQSPCTYEKDSGKDTFEEIMKLLTAFGDEMPPSHEGADRRNAMLFVHQLTTHMHDHMNSDRGVALQKVLRRHVDMLAPDTGPVPAELPSGSITLLKHSAL